MKILKKIDYIINEFGEKRIMILLTAVSKCNLYHCIK